MFAKQTNLDKVQFTEEGKKSVAEALAKALDAGGVEGALQQYRELKEKQPAAYDFNVDQLSVLGLRLMAKGRVEEAIAILKLNTEMFPKISYVHARLGDAYAQAGKKDLAVTSYKKALELDPFNTIALEMMRHLL